MSDRRLLCSVGLALIDASLVEDVSVGPVGRCQTFAVPLSLTVGLLVCLKLASMNDTNVPNLFKESVIEAVKDTMAQQQQSSSGICMHSGCYCKQYVVPTSKWSKGKCKQCNHSKKEHADLIADVTFDSQTIAAAPPSSSNNQYGAQIDNKMGIDPSGKTNYMDSPYGGVGQQQKQNNEPSIYSVCTQMPIISSHRLTHRDKHTRR